MQASDIPSFTCPDCGAISYHPKDVEQGYCGRCHWWTGDPVLGKVETEDEFDKVWRSAPVAHRATRSLRDTLKFYRRVKRNLSRRTSL